MRKVFAIALAGLQLLLLCLLAGKGNFDKAKAKKDVENALAYGTVVSLKPEGALIGFTEDGQWFMFDVAVYGDDSFTIEGLRDPAHFEKDAETGKYVVRPGEGHQPELSFTRGAYKDMSAGAYTLDPDEAASLFGPDVDKTRPDGTAYFQWREDVRLHWYACDWANEIEIGGVSYPVSIQAAVYQQEVYPVSLTVGSRVLTLTRVHLEEDD